MDDRRKYMDEGTRAIITEISRNITDTQYEKIERIIKERNEYLDGKFECVKVQIKEVKVVVDDIKKAGCTPTVNHITEHKEKDKRITRNVTIISTAIPTIILLGGWIKEIIIGWMQKPHTP